MRQWTKEERERQAALIRSWKPWERSTGPATDAGKAVAAGNAMKHGMRSAERIAERKSFNALLRECRDVLTQTRCQSK